MSKKPTYEELEQRILELEKREPVQSDQMSECEEKFHDLFHNSPIGIAYHRMIYDENGNPTDFYYLDANENFRQFTGSDPTGRMVTEVFPGIENDPDFDWIGTCARAARDGETVRFQRHLQPVDRWYDIVAFQNKPDHFVVSFLEITSLKHAEKERHTLQTQLAHAQKMEAIGTLAGGIAHDFNNILTGILGYTTLAQMTIDNPKALEDKITQIRRGAERAVNLVKQILTFSRQAEYEKYPLKLTLPVKEAVKFLKSLIPSIIEIEENIVSKSMVSADPTQIHQIVMNLCTNAFQNMKITGGKIRIRLEDYEIIDSKKADELDIALGNYVRLEVSDTGSGMDSNTLKRIFDPYFTTKNTGEGTGLGLPVVLGIVKEHNGHIRVSSQTGKGSTFHVYLPVISNRDVCPAEQAYETKTIPIC